MNKNKLTPKQELFCQTYVKTGNGSEAYRIAYDTSKTKPEVVNVKASEMLAKANIMVRIKELQQKLEKKHDITKDKIISHLCSVAFFDISRIANEDGSIKNINDLDSETKILLNGVIEKTIGQGINSEKTVSYRMNDKLRALDMLIKLLGYNEPEKIEHTGNITQTMTLDDFYK